MRVNTLHAQEAAPSDVGSEWLRQRVAALEDQVAAQAHEIEVLRRRGLRYRRFFDHSQVGMAITSLETGWVEFNQQLCDLLGYSPEELVKTNWIELTHPEDMTLDVALFHQLVQGEIHSYNIDKRFIRKDGSVLYGNIMVQGVYHPDGSVDHIIGFLHDLTERRRAETERLNAALKQEIIDAQKNALRELSTPLIPVADHVIVMPLLGTIDSVRAQAVLEALLAGVIKYQARITILDVTGVQAMGSEAANAVIRSAQAIKLLGARTILTGVQPRMAQLLVDLDVDLHTIMTLSTVQEAIAYALRACAAPPKAGHHARARRA